MKVIRIKKIISILLIISMVFSSTGIVTLADSIDDITKTEASGEASTTNYYYDGEENSQNQDKLEGEEPKEDEKPGQGEELEEDEKPEEGENSEKGEEPEEEKTEDGDEKKKDDEKEEPEEDKIDGDKPEGDKIEEKSEDNEAEKKDDEKEKIEEDKEEDKIEEEPKEGEVENKDSEKEEVKGEKKVEEPEDGEVDKKGDEKEEKDEPSEEVVASPSDAKESINELNEPGEEINENDLNNELLDLLNATNSEVQSTNIKEAIESSTTLFGAGPNSIEYILGTKSNVGTFVGGYTPPEDYIPGVNTDLPPADKIIPPVGRTFMCWMVNGERKDKVGATETGKVVATAVYRVDKDFYFGMYPQSSTVSTVVDPIKWVLHEHDDKVIAISEKAIDFKSLHNAEEDTTWADCDLRDWIRNTFYPNAFNADEKNVIEEVINQNRENPVTHVSSGIDTTDRIFLLDYFQGYIYFESDVGWSNDDRRKGPTAYARYKGTAGNYITWITRTMGSSGHRVVAVISAGIIAPGSATQPENGVSINNTNVGFVPAMFLDMDKPLYNAPERNITWILDGAEWLDESTWDDYKYREGYEVTLPTQGNFKPRNDKKTLIGWRIGSDPTIVNSIPATQTGDITLTAVWQRLNYITYNLGLEPTKGSFVAGYDVPEDYTPGDTMALPPANKVVPPNGRTFVCWIIDGVRATEIPSTATGEVVVTAVYKVNDYYYYGTHPQSTDQSDILDPIRWIPIEIGSDKVMLISHKVLDCKAWGTDANVEKTWADSDFRTYLNGTFYTNSFNDGERNQIQQVTIKTPDNGARDGGPDTLDRVFALSKEEVEYAFNNASDRRAKASRYVADIPGAIIDSMGNGSYWLRTPNSATAAPYNISIVNGSGDISDSDNSDDCMTIRPAIYLKATNSVYDANKSNITWTMNGGEWITESIWRYMTKYSEGQKITLPTEKNLKPRTGMTFAGWYLNGTRVTEIKETQTGNINLIAGWAYNINWVLGAGNSWRPGYVASASYISGEGLTLPASTSIIVPTGRVFDYWTVNGNPATKISTTQTGEVTVEAHYKNAEYEITWDLGTGADAGTWNSYTPPATYEYSVGLNLNTLPMSSKVKPPVGREFDHWTINGAPGTEISTTDTGEKTIKAIYRNLHYHITWQLGSNASWTGGAAPFDDYEYGANTALPTTGITFTGGKSFGSWAINGDAPKTNIPNNQINDIVVTLVYSGTPQYPIVWDLSGPGGSTWDTTADYSRGTQYTEGVEIPLPNNNQLIPPAGYVLDKWTINDAPITNAKIPADLSLNPGDTVTVGAVFKLPTPPPPPPTPAPGPTPSPYSGGGGSGRGGNYLGDPKTFDVYIFTNLKSNEYEWIKDVATDNWQIKVKKDTPIARAFKSSNMYVKYYSDIDNNYIMLKDGIFCIQYLNANYSFAFDANGKMVKGIINTDYFCKGMSVDLVSSSFIELNKIGVNKFYCYEELGNLEGAICTNSVIVGNIQYIIDEYGRLLSLVSIHNNIIM